MIPNDPIGIIELGNKNLKCLIFRINNNKAEILSTSITSSHGIYNDLVINLEKASNAVRVCIGSAEKKAKISLKKINVILEQSDFLCTKFSKHKKIHGSKIHNDDIEFLLNDAKKQLIHNDKNQSIIHIFNHNYIVDGKEYIEEPIDIYADSLAHEMTFITAPKNNLKNINEIFLNCDIEVARFFSRIFSLGAKLLTEKELQFGSAIINLDLERISLGFFKNFALVNSITLPFGTNNITKDISKVCSLDIDESEIIKNEIDFLFHKSQNIFDKDDFLKKKYFINSNYRKISKNLIINVIQARLEEIFNIIKNQLKISGFNLKLKVNLLLIEEDTSLLNLDKYCESFFETNVKKINNKDFNNYSELEKNFASHLGALKIIKDGWETEAIPKSPEISMKKINFFSKIFKNK